MGFKGLIARGVPPLPKWLLWVKIAIIVLSVIILALAAYALSLYSGYYYYSGGAPGYLIFLVIMTWIIYGISIALELAAPQYYYRIALFIAYIISCIFWLSGWAWSAAWAGAVLGFYDGLGNTFGSAMGACAGLGAIVWILCILNLVLFSLGCVRSEGSTHAGNVELGHAQKQDQNQTPYAQHQHTGQPEYLQQQPVYGQSQQPGHP
ncbi:hypothetical protein BJ170DRAFT_254808 [Xylariales sp. AK1849]|nr:hypothetical protein BJ170DRAFT_254808 [Xylariales sp. AK1849]